MLSRPNFVFLIFFVVVRKFHQIRAYRMDDRSELSAEERAEKLRAEKQKKDEMLLTRRNFEEPSVANEKTPDWLLLLQEKKRRKQAADEEILGDAHWLKLLEKQQALQEKMSQLGVNSSNAASMTSRIADVSDSGRRNQPEFNSTWLRQLRSEQE